VKLASEATPGRVEGTRGPAHVAGRDPGPHKEERCCEGEARSSRRCLSEEWLPRVHNLGFEVVDTPQKPALRQSRAPEVRHVLQGRDLGPTRRYAAARERDLPPTGHAREENGSLEYTTSEARPWTRGSAPQKPPLGESSPPEVRHVLQGRGQGPRQRRRTSLPPPLGELLARRGSLGRPRISETSFVDTPTGP
jgi:hypothetical protein